MSRRRRATGGPAERTFGTLVGLELRLRKMREAAGFIDRIIGGDVSSADVDALIAEIEKDAEDSGDV